jgi:putative ABC transport system permease protein
MFVKMLVNALVRRRSRMMAALLAVAIGATVLLGLAAVLDDIPRQMGREFRTYGANIVFVPAEGQSLGLEDIAGIREIVPPDELVGMTPYRYEIVRINMRGYTAAGTDFAEARRTSPYWNVSGAWPEKPDEILMGADIAGFAGLTPGSVVTVAGRGEDGARFSREMTVSGILRTGGTEDEFIFTHLATLTELFGGGTSGPSPQIRAHIVEASVAADEERLNAIAARVSAELPGVLPRLVKRVTRSEAGVLSKLRSLVLLVALVVPALTMICVATTMTAVVMERRKEIGLKKALGAGNRNIAAEFLGEGLFLGCAGGVLGTVCGYFFAQAVSVNVFGRGVDLEWSRFPATVLISALIAAAACLLPVKRAMDVEPAVVLRGE